MKIKLFILFLFIIDISVAQNAIIVVVDGARFTETFGATNPDSTIPHLWNDLMPLGTVYNNFYNSGITTTNPGHATLLTGTWQTIANDGSQRPTSPTVFEYFRKEKSALESENYVVAGKTKLTILTNSDDPDYGAAYMASDIHGDLTDDEVYANLIAAMDADHPKLILVNFPSVDRAGHAGNRDDYLSAITNVDNLIYQLWYKIVNNPYYKNTTTLFITNDHGRHTTDFSSHGDDCEGCRHLMLLALGRKIIPGKIVSEKKYQTALAPTIGELLSFTTTGAGDSSLFDANYSPATEMKYLTYHLIDSDVILNWETKIEINNYGFEVERSQNSMITKLQDWKSNGSQNPNWVKVGFVDGNGSSNLMNDYSFVDKSVPSGRYYYRLKQIDDDRKYRFSKQVEVVINKLPAYFLLVQNYPNPFNPTTTIEFAIPSANIVQVKVFNILGMEVAALLNELKQAGKHTVEFDAGNLASGIYFYKVVSGDNLEIKKMILLK